MNVIDLLFGHKFPREFGEKRIFVKDRATFYSMINRYNGIVPCFALIYSIPDYKKYSRVTIDKIYFDMDVKDASRVLKFHEYLMNLNLKHIMLFTGGGFAVYVFAEIKNLNYPKDVIETIQRKMAVDVGLTIGKPGESDIDFHVIGDTSRIARIPYTLNVKYKPHRRLCIPIYESDLKMGYDFIVKLSSIFEPDLIDASEYIYGSKLLDLKQYDQQKTIKAQLMDINMDKVNLENDDVYLKMLPPFVRYLLLREERAGNKERYWIVIALRDIGIPKNLAIQLFQKYLGQKGKIRDGGRFVPDVYHAIINERIFEFIYDYDARYLFPNWQTLENMGYPITNEDKRFEFYKKAIV